MAAIEDALWSLGKELQCAVWWVCKIGVGRMR